MIKILIIDDQEIITKGLQMVLSTEHDIDVLATGSNGSEAVSLVKKYLPDVVLMDIQMPLLNGVEAIRLIKKDYPSVSIIILTTFNDEQYIYDGIRNGASGYLLKDTPPKDIANAVRTVYGGGAIVQPNIASKLLRKFSEMSADGGVSEPERSSDTSAKSVDSSIKELTERELDIVKLVGEGKNNNEISEILFISEGTVKNNLTRILNKLSLRDRTQLAIFALKNNLV